MTRGVVVIKSAIKYTNTRHSGVSRNPGRHWMPPYQVQGRLIKSGMTEWIYLVAGLITADAPSPAMKRPSALSAPRKSIGYTKVLHTKHFSGDCVQAVSRSLCSLFSNNQAVARNIRKRKGAGIHFAFSLNRQPGRAHWRAKLGF
jgi:hypothetical protein